MCKKSISLSLLLILCCFPRILSATELYFLDNSQILLYKIINWWYYAPDGESAQLCGDHLKYVNNGNGKVSYVIDSSAIKISTNEGFASLLSLVKECETCSTPYSIRSAWLNQRYFPGASATLTIKESAFTNEYSILIKKTGKDALSKLKDHEKQLVFTLSGQVQGLQDGKVALNPKSDLLEKCFARGQKHASKSLAHLTVTSSGDGSTLMKFNIPVPIEDAALFPHK